MTIKTARKIGLWTAIAMLFGSIVGVGIFFKNGSITRATGDNGVATLLAWVVGGLVSLFAAIAFTEIGSQKLRNVHGLAAWSEIALGRKFGYFTRFNLAFFYYGILTVIFGVFVSEAFFQILAADDILKLPPIGVHIALGIGLDLLFLVLNYFSIHGAAWISRFSTALKIVPLILVSIAGIALATTNHHGGSSSFTNHKPFSFTGLLAALPAVLFAYDAFLNVGTFANKVKGGAKTVSKAIIVTLVCVLALYSLIAIAHILHGASDVIGLFGAVFPASAQHGLQTFVWVFLFISACGVANGVAAGAVAAVEQSTAVGTFLGSRYLCQHIGQRRASYFYQAIIFTFWALVIFIPSLILKSDALVDAISNFPTLFFFAIYGITIGGYGRKRQSTATEKINRHLWFIAATLAIVGITFVVVYQIIYGFTIQAFLKPNDPSHAGFLVGGQFTLIEFFGLFIACLVVFLLMPFINARLVMRCDKQTAVIDTQSTNDETVKPI